METIKSLWLSAIAVRRRYPWVAVAIAAVTLFAAIDIANDFQRRARNLREWQLEECNKLETWSRGKVIARIAFIQQCPGYDQ